ncbi:MAG: hypothetical protein IK040_05045 [Spirochaetia bacterium]|nr:hypothetical protein [Spirochaetia bacterium]MBR4436308.1 hypothetical protein [Spirochaetales bacterium]MBR4797046.1 hypothetical protein [Spirochaetia bacterium]MBR5017703.1 hypothetical protein [Spirochaetia bacterium]
MPIDKTKLTKELLDKAAKCETAEQLIALAKESGVELTKTEAEAYLAELENCELDNEELDKVAGGGYMDHKCWTENYDKT